MTVPRWATWLKLLAVICCWRLAATKTLDVAKYSVALASEDATEEACQSRIEVMNSSGGVCSTSNPLIAESGEYLNFCKGYCVDPNGPEYNTCRGRMTIADAGQPSCRFDEDNNVFELVCATVTARCVCGRSVLTFRLTGCWEKAG